MVDNLARVLVRYRIRRGTIVGDESVENTLIQSFLNNNSEENTENERHEAEGIIADRVRAMMTVAKEVGFFWRDERSNRRQPIPSLQRAVMDIMANLDSESTEYLEEGEIREEFGTAPDFELRHQRAEEAIISRAFLGGQDRMNSDYPRLLELWRTYVEKIPARRRTLVQSDLGALRNEIDNFVNRAQTEQQRAFANELRAALIGIWVWRSELPELLDGMRPSIARTKTFAMDHRTLVRTFERLHEFDLIRSLPITWAAWRGYLDHFPVDLRSLPITQTAWRGYLERYPTDLHDFIEGDLKDS